MKPPAPVTRIRFGALMEIPSFRPAGGVETNVSSESAREGATLHSQATGGHAGRSLSLPLRDAKSRRQVKGQPTSWGQERSQVPPAAIERTLRQPPFTNSRLPSMRMRCERDLQFLPSCEDRLSGVRIAGEKCGAMF